MHGLVNSSGIGISQIVLQFLDSPVPILKTGQVFLLLHQQLVDVLIHLLEVLVLRVQHFLQLLVVLLELLQLRFEVQLVLLHELNQLVLLLQLSFKVHELLLPDRHVEVVVALFVLHFFSQHLHFQLLDFLKRLKFLGQFFVLDGVHWIWPVLFQLILQIGSQLPEVVVLINHFVVFVDELIVVLVDEIDEFLKLFSFMGFIGWLLNFELFGHLSGELLRDADFLEGRGRNVGIIGELVLGHVTEVDAGHSVGQLRLALDFISHHLVFAVHL